MSDNIAKLGFEIDTTPLSRAAVEAQRAAQQMGQLGAAADKAAAQTKEAAGNAGGLTDQLGKVNGVLRMSSQELSQMGAALGAGGFSGAMGAAAGMAGRLIAALGPLGIAAAGVGVLGAAFYAINKPLAEAADRMALMEGRMRNALGSTIAAQGAMAALFEQTQKTGLGFQSAADAFLRIARNAESLGATQGQILQLSDTIQKLGKASGASTGEIQSGMVQLGQALASGRLNGDELRSIMENMPALAKAIAEGLGVGVGQIRALGAAGELTSSKVFEAILKASQKANEEFAKLPQTVEQANQRVADSWDRLLSNLGTKLNSSGIIQWFANLSNTMVSSVADALAPATLQERLEQARRELQRLDNGTVAGRALLRGSPQEIAAAQERVRQLEEQVQKEREEAQRKEEERLNAPFNQTVEAASNEFDNGRKELQAAQKLRDDIKKQLDGIRALPPDLRNAAENTALPNLERQLVQAEEAVNKLAGGAAKARQSLNDLRDAMKLGGGGGGISIAQNAIQQAQAARAAGQGGSVQDFIALGTQEAAVRAQQQVAALERQAAGQEKLAGATGKTRDAVRELEIAQEVADFRFQTFGTLTGPAVEKAVGNYEKALRRTKVAQDALGDEQAFQTVRDNLAAIAAQMAVVEQGAYAMRRAAAEARADAANRQRPGAGIGVIQEFDASERLAAAQRIDEMRRQNTRLLDDGDVIGDPAAQREMRMRREIEDAQRGAAPDQAGSIRREIELRYERERTNDLKAQNVEIKRQTDMAKERVALIGLTGERLAVETALLEKRNQLQQQGVDLASQEAIAILESTEALAQQNYKIQKAQEEATKYQKIWDNAARNIQEGLANAFEDAFRKGTLSMQTFFDLFSNVALKVASNIISAQVVDPLTKAFTDLAGPFVKGVFGGMFGGSPTSQTFPISVGNAYGNVIPFARGGVVSSPTVFGMASGANGVAGEAGPEAVLPLKRGNDGRLGVGAGGSGNVSITVIDQRTSEGSKPVEVQESRGPDGQRLIQLLVRDEVRRAIRSGDLDRDMQASYGNQRRLVNR